MKRIEKNVTKVLGEDVVNYFREMDVAISCIEEMKDSLLDGDLEDVFLCVKDLQEAVQLLQVMFVKKERRDKLIEVVNDLRSRGMKVDFVSRLKNEEAASAATLTATN
ncbi:MAG TPA: hypothetical protein GX497_03325 [Bacillus bacterium]|nr:hypothetical protein [Bacillus sp. (in: firmicutes)]